MAADRQADTRLAFVTHNVRDFSEVAGDQRKPHADLLPLFDGTVSTYSVDLIDVIKQIDEDLLANHDFEFNDFFSHDGCPKSLRPSICCSVRFGTTGIGI